MNNQQRTRELENLALQNNWSFSPTANISSVSAIQNFEFHTGEKRKVEKIENLIKGIIEGSNFAVADVYWQRSFDSSDALAATYHKDITAQNVRQQTIFLIESKVLQLPQFHVYPANSLSLIDKWLDKTFRRIGFPAHPEFEKRYAVRGSNQEKIVDRFGKNIIEFYEKADEFWTFADNNYIFIYQPNVLTPAFELLHRINMVFTLSKLLGK